MGRCCLHGRGIEKDAERAAAYYREASAQGYPLDMGEIGYLFDNGNGVRADPVRTAELYRHAAEQGNAEAQYQLGRC